MTSFQGIPSISRQTITSGGVIINLTLRINATRAGAGVPALVINAGPSAGAVSVQHALWATPCVRVPGVLGQARAGPCAAQLFAHRVSAARRRAARIPRSFCY